MSSEAVLLAGSPDLNAALYHRCRFLCGDPAAWVRLPSGERVLLVRDIELGRARQVTTADRAHALQEFEPKGAGGDREISSALSTAAFLQGEGVTRVTCDRSLPLMFAEACREAGIEVVYDADLGVLDRRAKDEQEIGWLRAAQGVTERVIAQACEMIATADARANGVLERDGETLTSERVLFAIDVWLLEHGYENPVSIVAGGPQGADCHERGSGELRTGEPVIIDVFPRNRTSRYWGDCTRCVVHGDVPGEVAAMHAAVVKAKAASIASVRAGATGGDVHAATVRSLRADGFDEGPDTSRPSMVHGTGHGVGLAVHEPPLLVAGGPELVAGDCLTIEPGLYKAGLGGIRIEDMVIVTENGCMNLNSIQEGLDWR